MPDLYYLAFRDLSTTSTGVMSGEVYKQADVSPTTNWPKTSPSDLIRVPWGDVPGLFRGQRVCFLVHGFNVPATHAIWCEGPAAQEFEALGKLGLQITAADIVVTVMWPGDGLLGWNWFTAYGHSKETGRNFVDFLTQNAAQASEISFISHSLGARVVLETVAQAKDKDLPFGTAVLMAAAVDDNALDDGEYSAASAALKRIVVLSSMQDEVLEYLFTAGSLVERALWWSYDGTSRALGRYGPAFAANSKVPAKTEWYEIKPSVKQGHHNYLPAGDQLPGPPYGWGTTQKETGAFCRDLFDARPPLPDLPDWGIDHTRSFRPDWPPKF
jgi:hypothetical protein